MTTKLLTLALSCIYFASSVGCVFASCAEKVFEPALKIQKKLLEKETSDGKGYTYGGSNDPRFIVLHYTGYIRSVDGLYNYFQKEGLSSHYVVDRNGDIYKFVDPQYIAYHAGDSGWQDIMWTAGKTPGLNSFSIGIENANSGYFYPEEVPQGQEPEKVRKAEIEKDGQPISLAGDPLKGRTWFEFNDENIESLGNLVYQLEVAYKIPEWDVLLHSDITLRKVDMGPLGQYEKLAREYHAGYWPQTVNFDMKLFEEVPDDIYYKIIEAFGYNKNAFLDKEGRYRNMLLQHWCIHFYPNDFKGELTSDIKRAIINMSLDLYDFESYAVPGMRPDYFINKFNNLRKESRELSEALTAYYKFKRKL